MRTSALWASCVAIACASAPASPPAPVPPEAHEAPPAPPEPSAEPSPEPSPEPSAAAAPPTPSEPVAPQPPAPESPVMLRVAYGNLGTGAGSEWAVHADGSIRGKVCDEPRERAISAAEVEALHAKLKSCKLCKIPESNGSGSNADKQIYRVTASWPDVSCERDVSMQSRFHYDSRAKKCLAVVEAVLDAMVAACPGELIPE